MVVKLHDIKEFITSGLQDVDWEDLIGVDVKEINNKELVVTYSELQDIRSNPICESKYKITVELCEE